MSELNEIVSSRFTEAEKSVLQAAAEREGVSLSTFVRNTMLSAELRSRPGAVVKWLPNGAPLVWWTATPEAFQVG